MSANQTFTFHRLFGDINGDGTVNAADQTAFLAAYNSRTSSPNFEPAFDYDDNGRVNNADYNQFLTNYDAGTTYTYTSTGPVLSGVSTTAAAGATDISSWAGGAVSLYYSGSNVIEERQAGTTGAWRQEVWGLGYVNSLIEQDTATAVDSGGVLPTSHLLKYALDTSFNGTGVEVGGSGSYDSVAIQPADNKIVVAGISGSNLIVTRYYPNGTVDTSFGTSGTVTLAETSPTFCKLVLDSSGNIVVAVNDGSAVQISRLTPAGALDTTFGTGGQTSVSFSTTVVPQGLAIDPSGNIVVAGDSSSGAGIYLARLTSAGALDTTFGSSGTVNAPLSGNPSGLSLAFDSTGRILVGGSDSGNFSVVRFTTAGAVDSTFGTSGEATVDLGGTDTAYTVSPGPGGTIVAAGVSVQSGSNDAAVIRLTGTGALDATFGTGGKVLGSSGSGTIRAMVVETNGAILAGGDAGSGTAQEVWKFTPSGTPDTSFATGGTITANSGATVFGWAITSGLTQRVVVAGSYDGDTALAAFAPASVRLYAQQDANYDVTAMADANGNVVQRYVYSAYGSMTVLSATWTPQSDLFDTQVGFQGMWLDQASGLYHTPNRDYDPATGTWREADPTGYGDGSNPYESYQDNSSSGTDPQGTDYIFGKPFMAIGWLQKMPGGGMVNLVANPAPPSAFSLDPIAGMEVLGGWETKDEYRDLLQITPYIETDATGTITAANASVVQNVGYTKLLVTLQGNASTSPLKITYGPGKHSATFTTVAKFRVNMFENLGQATIHWGISSVTGNRGSAGSGNLYGWMWQKVEYTLRCDGSYHIDFGASFVPSETYYYDYQSIHSYSMASNPGGVKIDLNTPGNLTAPGMFNGALTSAP